MSIKVRAIALAAILLPALFVPDCCVYGQSPTPSPSSASSDSTVDKTKSDLAAAAQAAAPKPDPTPEPDFWHQEKMTGDWGGDRSRWKEEGVELEFKLTQFYQGGFGWDT